MSHPDPYRFTGPADDHGQPARSGVSRSDVLRALLWTVLVISVLANSVASYGDASTAVHLAFGVVTAACATVLVVQRLRGRR
ncbi:MULTISPECIES: hypothetical protein [unclassified Streptomyces]|uniref:hypothetical protein n=1 Tax=unclassified Streptomyces TaxID=2593676 RepID=UPI0004BD2DB1|nr:MULTISPECIES: hypothetical protein [unclassified Streptomyces]